MTDISSNPFPADLELSPMLKAIDHFDQSEMVFFKACMLYRESGGNDEVLPALISSANLYIESYKTNIDYYLDEDMDFQEFAIVTSALILTKDLSRVDHLNEMLPNNVLETKDYRFPKVDKQLLTQTSESDLLKNKIMWSNGCANLFRMSVEADVNTFYRAAS